MQEPELSHWIHLVTSARETTCESVHLHLYSLPREEAVRWSAIEPILGMHFNRSGKTDSPFLPVEAVQSLDKEMLARLAEMANEIPSADIAARVLDLAWIHRLEGAKFAPLAIEKYLVSAAEHLSVESWIDTYSRYERAMKVALSAGRKRSLHVQVISAVEQVIDEINNDDPLYLTSNLMHLLLRNKFGSPVKYSQLCHHLADKAREGYERGDLSSIQYERERTFLELEMKWFRIYPADQRDEETIQKLRLEIAESFVRQANGALNTESHNAKFIASLFLEDAIGELRKIPGQQERAEELRLKQLVLRREAVNEMPTFAFSEDITAEAEAVVNHVTREDPLDSVFSLAMMYSPFRLEDLRSKKQQLDEEYVSRRLLPAVYFGPRGTTVAKHVSEAETGEGRLANEEMELLRLAHQEQCKRSARLAIAAEAVYASHGLDSHWFSSLAMMSEFVPEGRVDIFGRGLAAGLHADYEMSTSLLVPQFEHALRELFFREGIVTATLPDNGIQNEISLNVLLEHVAASRILGEELLYDLRALLTEKAGGNLRNDVAHGLLDAEAKIGAKIYFWSVCLRFVCGTLYLPFREGEAQRLFSRKDKHET